MISGKCNTPKTYLHFRTMEHTFFAGEIIPQYSKNQVNNTNIIKIRKIINIIKCTDFLVMILELLRFENYILCYSNHFISLKLIFLP